MRVEHLRLGGGAVLLVKGPSTVEAESGVLSAVGIPLKAGEKVVVRRGKSIPFEADAEELSVVVSTAADGEYSIDGGRVGVGMWGDVAERVLAPLKKPSTCVIVGETDAGKSTLAAFLVNRALLNSLRPGVIDADVGQGDLAPPGCVGASVIQRPLLDLRDAKATCFQFIGFTSPRYGRDSIIDAIERCRMTLELEGADLLVVNTDGYVREEGLNHKMEMVRRIQPDAVVCLENPARRGDLSSPLRDAFGEGVVTAPTPDNIGKERTERIERRLTQYRRFLQGRVRRNLPLGKLALSYLGRRYRFGVEPPRGAYLGRSLVKEDAKGNRLTLVSGPPTVAEASEAGIRQTTASTGALYLMFVGLGLEGRTVAFGLVTGADLRGTLSVETPWRGDVDTVILGSIHLTPDLKSEYVLPTAGP